MNCKQMRKLGIAEVFLPIDGFSNHEVSNYGNVRYIVCAKLDIETNCQQEEWL